VATFTWELFSESSSLHNVISINYFCVFKSSVLQDCRLSAKNLRDHIDDSLGLDDQSIADLRYLVLIMEAYN
jgi:hypothetical protein